MELYIPHSIFHLARLLYVRPENFWTHYVYDIKQQTVFDTASRNYSKYQNLLRLIDFKYIFID